MKKTIRNTFFIRTREAGSLFLQGFNQLFWPQVCINCHKSISDGDENLCKTCWQQLSACSGADYCRRCGREASRAAIIDDACPDCQGQEIHFDRIARAGAYRDSLREMILAFKNNKTELDVILAFLAQTALDGSDFREKIEIFVPVPLHWSRQLYRGYNQSQIIAARLGRKKPKIKLSTDLVRIRRTKAQPTMASPAARIRNVAGAFAVRNGHRFAGRTVCLVDDVKTTGATLNECARILKQAGAKEVFAVVLAIAGQNIS